MACPADLLERLTAVARKVETENAGAVAMLCSWYRCRLGASLLGPVLYDLAILSPPCTELDRKVGMGPEDVPETRPLLQQIG